MSHKQTIPFHLLIHQEGKTLLSFLKLWEKSLKRRFTGLNGFRNRLEYKRHRIAVRSLSMLGMSQLLLGQPFSADERRSEVSNFQLLHPAETLDFNTPGLPYAADPFLRSCQHIVEGRLERGSIFTCELPDAKFSPENGLLYDSRWLGVVESVLNWSRHYTFRKTFRPRSLTRRTGIFSSVRHPWHHNNWHWTADSLPQILSLAIHMRGRPLTLLMSEDIGRVHRDSLEAVLPDNFKIEYVNPHEWFEVELFVLPSHVSSVANAFFPPDYYEFIRSNTFRKLGTPKFDKPGGRYYISRGRAKHRRILNEVALMNFLETFGFLKIFIEDYTFAAQVELFRNAEVIASPHGAALGGMIYADNAKVCVFYPEARPAGYFYTLARGVGLQHFCTNADRAEDDDFEVDLGKLRHILEHEMRLNRSL